MTVNEIGKEEEVAGGSRGCAIWDVYLEPLCLRVWLIKKRSQLGLEASICLTSPSWLVYLAGR